MSRSAVEGRGKPGSPHTVEGLVATAGQPAKSYNVIPAGEEARPKDAVRIVPVPLGHEVVEGDHVHGAALHDVPLREPLLVEAQLQVRRGDGLAQVEDAAAREVVRSKVVRDDAELVEREDVAAHARQVFEGEGRRVSVEEFLEDPP